MINYTHLPDLNEIVLEESWVLAITVKACHVRFAIEAVLTDSHPLYEPHHTGEQFCYKKSIWEFQDVRSVVWTMRNKPAIDANGEYDYGHFDEVNIEPPSYTILGDFGAMTIISSEPRLTILD